MVCFARTNFYPRPPRGGRLLCHLKLRLAFIISIHALREEGDDRAAGLSVQRIISIHALREEGDTVIRVGNLLVGNISIHALREEGDRHGFCIKRGKNLFLSTPSARRATNPHCSAASQRPISIHALREEGDRPRHPH